MASDLTATVFVNAMLKAKDNMMKFEKRRPDLGVLETFDKYSDGVINPSEQARLKASMRRPVETVVRKKSAPPVLHTRTVNAQPHGSQTAKVSLNYKTYGGAIGINESINADNYLDSTDDLAGQAEDLMRAICLEAEADGIDFFEASKYSALPTSSLMGAPAGGAYNTNTKDLFLHTPAVMRRLQMTGPYHMIGNVEGMATVLEKTTFGQYNQQNLQKLLDGYEFAYSGSIIPSAGNFTTNYVIPTNSLGMTQWVEYDCRKGIGSYDSGLKYFTMPFSFTSLSGYTFTFNMGVVYVGKTVDASAILPNLERSYAEFWYPFFDLSFTKAYSSEAGKSPIVKMNVAPV